MTRQKQHNAMTYSDHQNHDNTTNHDSAETTKTRIISALAEARKARHHRDCYCRHFDKTACNAADALWTRAYTRELAKLYPKTQGEPT